MTHTSRDLEGILGLIRKIGGQEASRKVFVSPVCTNTMVATHIEKIIYTFSIPKVAEGWYRIRPKDKKGAEILGPAGLPEIEKYLKCLEKIRFVLVMKQNGAFFGIPDNANRFGLKPNDLQPIHLCGDAPLDFDRIIARFDGANFWFECIDPGNDQSKAGYLRQSMAKPVQPKNIKFSGLELEEKHAYSLRLAIDRKLTADLQKDSLKQDVEFAGGKFRDFTERSDHYSVNYTVDGQEFTSYVSKDPKHMVITAGLCLSGGDRKFDLKSLVTVIREGQHRKAVVAGDYGPDRNEWEDDD